METAVFSRFLARFCAEKVLRWLIQTSLLESNVQLPEIRLQLSTPRSGKLEIPDSTSNIWKLEFDFRLLTLGTWISTFTLWKMDSNFQQPTSGSWKVGIGNPTPNCRVIGFIHVSAWWGGFVAAGRSHVLIDSLVPRLQANRLCVGKSSLV